MKCKTIIRAMLALPKMVILLRLVKIHKMNRSKSAVALIKVSRWSKLSIMLLRTPNLLLMNMKWKNNKTRASNKKKKLTMMKMMTTIRRRKISIVKGNLNNPMRNLTRTIMILKIINSISQMKRYRRILNCNFWLSRI